MIVKLDLNKYEELIKQLVPVITGGSEPLLTKCEYLGYAVIRICLRYLNGVNYGASYFNSALFAEPKKKAINDISDKIGNLFVGFEFLDLLEDLENVILTLKNEVVSVLKEYHSNISLYVDSVFEQIKVYLTDAKVPNTGNQRDVIVSFRKYITLNHILTRVSND